MNTTILYSFPDDLKYRYMSFNTYEQALKAIELFKQIEVKAEVKVWTNSSILHPNSFTIG